MIHLRPDNALACFESVFERWKPTKSILCSLVTSLWYNSYFIYLYLSISTLSIIFSNESALHIRWPKYWSFSFSFSISPSNEHSGVISFRRDWLDLLAVQGILKSSPTPKFRSTYVYVYPLPFECPSHPHPHLNPLGHYRALSWTPCAIQRLPTS